MAIDHKAPCGRLWGHPGANIAVGQILHPATAVANQVMVVWPQTAHAIAHNSVGRHHGIDRPAGAQECQGALQSAQTEPGRPAASPLQQDGRGDAGARAIKGGDNRLPLRGAPHSGGLQQTPDRFLTRPGGTMHISIHGHGVPQ